MNNNELRWLRNAAKSSQQYRAFLRRRRSNEPLQYILGSQPFGPLDIRVDPPVLIPRPETEEWTIRLAKLLTSSPPRTRSMIDLGTGSGCIPLLLCHLLPQGSLQAVGVDITQHALDLANENAVLCGFHFQPEMKSTKNTFSAVQGNMLSGILPLHPPYDILTSNPPYISWKEYLQLPPDVSEFEDPRALFGGPDGLDFYRAIARIVSLDGFLAPQAVVALEVGHEQALAVKDMLHNVGGLKNIHIWKDVWGKQRTVVAQL